MKWHAIFGRRGVKWERNINMIVHAYVYLLIFVSKSYRKYSPKVIQMLIYGERKSTGSNRDGRRNSLNVFCNLILALETFMF